MVRAPSGSVAIYQRTDSGPDEDSFEFRRVVGWDDDGSPLAVSPRGSLRLASDLGDLVRVEVPIVDQVQLIDGPDT